MATIGFETIFTTDMRDSKGSTMCLVEVTGLEGNYTTGGVDITPDQFGLQSISFIGGNNFFAFPNDAGTYDAEGDWTKSVDIQPQLVQQDDGSFAWKFLVFLYGMDSAELPDGTPMGFIPQIPVRMLVLGSNRPDRR